MTDCAVSAEKFVFIQANFWEGRLYYPLVRFLNREQPHILSVQELMSGDVLVQPGYLTQEALFKENLVDDVAEGPPRSWMMFRQNLYRQRCATFTNGQAKIISINHVVLYRNTDDMSDRETEYAAYTGLLHTVIELGNAGTVHVLNHHGRLVIDKRMGSDIADYNFQKIAAYIATLNGGVILSGDFNLVKEASSLQPLKDLGLCNLNDLYGITEVRNEFAWKSDEAVSHIFVNDRIDIADYKVATDNVSDHLPLILHFGLKDI